MTNCIDTFEAGPLSGKSGCRITLRGAGENFEGGLLDFSGIGPAEEVTDEEGVTVKKIDYVRKVCQNEAVIFVQYGCILHETRVVK